MQNLNSTKSQKGQRQPSPVPSRSSSASSGSALSRPDVILSQTKVRAIMKSSPEVESVGNDALFMVTKAAELFVDYMARTTVVTPRGLKSYEYGNLSEVVRRESNLEFMRDILPMKISGRQALQEVAKQQALMMDKLI